jgi:hypothetical protein
MSGSTFCRQNMLKGEISVFAKTKTDNSITKELIIECCAIHKESRNLYYVCISCIDIPQDF